MFPAQAGVNLKKEDKMKYTVCVPRVGGSDPKG